jgi:DNA-binding GntR family transcriptional regulator
VRRRAKLLDIDTALGVMLTALDARTLGRIEQTFEAVALDGLGATQLGVKKGSPSLRAHRAYYDRNGKLILVAISWHRGDLFRISTVLKHETD